MTSKMQSRTRIPLQEIQANIRNIGVTPGKQLLEVAPVKELLISKEESQKFTLLSDVPSQESADDSEEESLEAGDDADIDDDDEYHTAPPATDRERSAYIVACVPQYSQEIHSYMKEREVRYFPMEIERDLLLLLSFPFIEAETSELLIFDQTKRTHCFDATNFDRLVNGCLH